MGLKGSAQGFNPGNRPPKRRALKAREAGKINLAPIAARNLNAQSRRATILFCFHVVSTLNLPPLQLRRASLCPERLGFQRPSVAPVGSTIMLSQPAPMISVTSLITVAPSDLAFSVAAAISSTRT